MNELFALAEQRFLAGELAEAHGVLETMRKEVIRITLLGEAGELQQLHVRQAFLCFKAVVARCKRRDQMLFALYSRRLQEAALV